MQAIEAVTQASRWGRGHPTPSLNRLLCFETGDVPPRRPLDDSEPVLVRQVPGSAHQFCWVASPLGRETSPARCQPANRARSAGNLSLRASNSAPSPSGRVTIFFRRSPGNMFGMLQVLPDAPKAGYRGHSVCCQHPASPSNGKRCPPPTPYHRYATSTRIKPTLVQNGLGDGYHQMPLRKEHLHYTCTSTPRGVVEWTVLVMGSKCGKLI